MRDLSGGMDLDEEEAKEGQTSSYYKALIENEEIEKN